VETQPQAGSRGGGICDEASSCLHGLYSQWPRKESCLSFWPWF
jgi:hypothetical protein